jgi:hypothetical protein
LRYGIGQPFHQGDPINHVFIFEGAGSALFTFFQNFLDEVPIFKVVFSEND